MRKDDGWMIDPPCFLLQVEEGGTSPLTSSVLSATDLDAPADLLTFTVVTPPAHGRLVRIGQGGQGVEVSQRRSHLLPLPLPVTSFTLQELQQGEGAGLTYLSITGLDGWCLTAYSPGQV